MKVILFIRQSSEMYGSDKVLLYLTDGLRKAKKVLCGGSSTCHWSTS